MLIVTFFKELIADVLTRLTLLGKLLFILQCLIVITPIKQVINLLQFPMTSLVIVVIMIVTIVYIFLSLGFIINYVYYLDEIYKNKFDSDTILIKAMNTFFKLNLINVPLIIMFSDITIIQIYFLIPGLVAVIFYVIDKITDESSTSILKKLHLKRYIVKGKTSK